jgi:DNA-directed RNA polymerase subunit beta'
LIPAGTGMRGYEKMVVGSQEEYDALKRTVDETVEIEIESN